jgi:amidase
VIAGKDSNDNFTFAQPDAVPDFTKALKKGAFMGKRIGVPRRVFLNNSVTGTDPSINVAFEQALHVIRKLGATVVDPADVPSAEEIVNSKQEYVVVYTNFKVIPEDVSCEVILYPFVKVQIKRWFKSLVENPSGVRSLRDLIQFNTDHPELEQPPQFTNQSM